MSTSTMTTSSTIRERLLRLRNRTTTSTTSTIERERLLPLLRLLPRRRLPSPATPTSTTSPDVGYFLCYDYIDYFDYYDYLHDDDPRTTPSTTSPTSLSTSQRHRRCLKDLFPALPRRSPLSGVEPEDLLSTRVHPNPNSYIPMPYFL